MQGQIKTLISAESIIEDLFICCCKQEHRCAYLLCRMMQGQLLALVSVIHICTINLQRIRQTFSVAPVAKRLKKFLLNASFCLHTSYSTLAQPTWK